MRTRLKPLVIRLGLALGLGTGFGAVPFSVQASDPPAPWQPFPQWKDTPRERRVARSDPLTIRAAALVANKAPARPEGGVTVPVTNCNDEGDGSLRDAIQNIAVSGDTVDMRGLNCSTITLTAGSIATAADDLTIRGPGTDMNGVTILAGHYSQIFVHLGSGTLTLEYLTVIDGGNYSTGATDALGGCVYSYGQVSLRNAGVKYCVAETEGSGEASGGGVYAKTGITAVSSTIFGNAARGDESNPAGGGFFTLGSLFINYSWLHGNEATRATGPIGGIGGALWSDGDATILNSTLSGNTAEIVGGAFLKGERANSNLEITNTTIYDNYSQESRFGSGLFVTSPIIISNSTITGNVARYSVSVRAGAGIYLGQSAAATLQSTIVSGNWFYDGTTFFPDDIGHSVAGGALVGGANNIVGYSTLPLSLDTIVTSDPRLGGLTTGNGGPTPTKAPLRDSPAINHGNDASGSLYDQRGPGFPRVIGPLADIGAVESDVIFSNGFD
jgi:hypothetical protein